MRGVVLIGAVVLGCSGTDAPSSTKDNAARGPITRLDLPHADDPARVMVLADAKPTALVYVGASGKLEVGRAGPAWPGNLAAATDRVATDIAELRKSVLETVVAGKGRHAASAQAELERERDPNHLARQAAIAQARVSGLLGSTGGPDVPGRGRLPGSTAIPIDRLDRTAPLVIATPSAPATAVVRVLQHTGGALGVDHQGKLAVLDLGFAIEDLALAGQASWIELYSDAKGLHLVVQPEERDVVVDWQGAAIDTAALGAAYDRAGQGKLHIDLLVREDTTMQTLVDMLAALDTIGVAHVGIANGPSTMEQRRGQIAMARRAGALGASLAPGSISSQGDLDKAVIRDHVLGKIGQIRACYERQLLARPHLAGTVNVQFFITPTGKVASANAGGVDPEVASCVATVIKSIEFPQPAGGGGVQVNYPFTFAPAP